MLKGVMLLITGLSLTLLSPGDVFAALSSSSAQLANQSHHNSFIAATDLNAHYDQHFIDEMVLHHQGAVMSAAMMIGNSPRPELRDLARRIQEGQQRQIDQMRAWRAQWYPEAEAPATGTDGMMGGRDRSGMMGSGGMMGNQAHDRMFLQMMIPHHQRAIDMAQDALASAHHQELKDLAAEIIADQSAEIAEMEGYLNAWYGTASPGHLAATGCSGMQGMMGAKSSAKS